MVVRLTDKLAKALPPPATGNRITFDTEIKGFGLRVTAAGARSFVLNYSARGIGRRLTIGSLPSWSVTQARAQARALRRRIDVGEDPLADRRAEREAPTVADLAARYLREHAARKKPRGLSEDTAIVRQHVLPRLGRLRVADVRRQDIEAFHRAISQTTPVRANRTLALVAKMFGLSVQWELRPDNPCRGVSYNRETGRERYLTPAELGRLMTALAADKRQDRANAVRLLLLTGARRGEVVHARWDEFDLTAGVWTKPASRTKQQKLHRVPLSAPARLIVAEMHATAAGPMLFPPRRRDGAHADLSAFWRQVCVAAGLEGVRLHDLRHSYASFLASGGLSLPVIGHCWGIPRPPRRSATAICSTIRCERQPRRLGRSWRMPRQQPGGRPGDGQSARRPTHPCRASPR